MTIVRARRAKGRTTAGRLKVSESPKPFPTVCASVVRRTWPGLGRLPVSRAAVYRELGYWWAEVVPWEYRHHGTDALAALCLASACDPLRLVRWWIASGDYAPWLAVPRTLAVLSRIDEDWARAAAAALSEDAPVLPSSGLTDAF